MERELPGSYNLVLVLLSLGIAVLASYAALDLADRVTATPGRSRWNWLGGGALAMGSGIWAMHFIAMLALQLPLAVDYDVPTTLLSLIYAVVASGIALGLLSRPSCPTPLWLAGGTCMGLAIAWMHYTGMAALYIEAHLRYQPAVVLLSVLIAIGASLIALGLAFRLRGQHSQRRWQQIGSAVVMGGAISGMHYTGMAATHFLALTDFRALTSEAGPSVLPGGFPGVGQIWLAAGVAIATLLILGLTLLTSLIDQQIARQQLRQRTLKDSEARFRALVGNLQVGVLVCNAQGQVLLSNEVAKDLLGLAAAEATSAGTAGELRRRVFFREDGTPFATADLPLHRAVAERQPVHNVVMGLDAPPLRHRLWLLVNANPEFSPEGHLDRVVCTFIDITVRKQAEAMVRETAEREQATSRIILRMRQSLKLELIFDTTTVELQQAIECDRVLLYRFNPDWSGTLVSEAVGSYWEPLLPLRSNDPAITRVAIDDPDCATTHLGIEGLIRDTHLQETSGGIYRQRSSYCCVPDVHRAGFSQCYLDLLEQLQARAYVIAPIFCGSQLWGLLAAYQNSGPRQWQESEVRIVTQVANQLGVAVQQAELFAKTQQQTVELLQAKDAADAASRAKGEFLANMSHELRTPLNAILGFTQLMQRHRSLSPEHQRYVEIINHSGEYLLGLINDVLEMSKIEAGRATLRTSDFNLHRLLQGLESMLQLPADTKRLQLQFDLGSEVPEYINADENKLRQILINLLGNAIKFTEKGRVTLRVHGSLPQLAAEMSPAVETAVLSETDGNPLILTFEVEDTGPGIAAEEIDDLFKAFHQTQVGRNSQEGTGLGLRISQKFVQLMGGEIQVSSEVGQGSCFTFSIRAALAEPPGATRGGQLVVGLQPGQPHYRILVAEDNVVNRLLLVKLLGELGLDVLEAEDGHRAIALWQEWQPQLIFMDMHMPNCDGYCATRQIRQRAEATGALRPTIIAITASAFAEQRQQCLTEGCDDFVSKPFRREELLQTLSKHLGLEYRCEPVAPALPAAAETTGSPSVINEASLAAMPSAWLAQLHRAAAQGNDALSLKLISQIPAEQAPLMEALTRLVENYQFDQLMVVTKR